MHKPTAFLLVTAAALGALLASFPALERSAGAAGTLPGSAALNRTVTPNRDGKNDTFVFKCYNPKDYRISAAVYGLRGERIAVMRVKSESYPYSYLEWDPDSGGKAAGGVYLYEVIVSDKSYKGTVVVVR